MTSYALPFSSALAGVAGLLFFFIFFVAVAAWIFRPGSERQYRKYAQIPFREEDNERK
ncbi:MAG: cbb3-type cytochrome c oxidase subunit 3 [Alphaproteobacteria bacterium]|nr:cbb3-type cytochrome c oxidase subunit 3 [Alphaproteobacteria bacterium]